MDSATPPNGMHAQAQPLVGRVTFQRLFDLRHDPHLRQATTTSTTTPPTQQQDIVGVVLLHGSWQPPSSPEVLEYWTHHSLVDIDASTFSATLAVNDGDDDLEFCLENYAVLPATLPAVMIVVQTRTMERSQPRFVTSLPTLPLMLMGVPPPHHMTRKKSSIPTSPEKLKLRQRRQILCSVTDQVDHAIDEFALSVRPSTAQRLFVAGDRSSVGKSSICLGILATASMPEESLAYIKPATQSESPQLIEHYCKAMGIACVPVGPLVYYRGFTRAFLAGTTSPPADLLANCAAAVNRIARGKRLVLVDGVGFPAVGSICGTSNANVAQACGVDGVLLVGGSGVGGAVDAYNLNAQYFATTDVVVLGAVFNKLQTRGYYSLEDCRKQVESYFEQYQPHRQAFGFVPKFPFLSMENVATYLETFASHVNVQAILDALSKKDKSSRHLDSNTGVPVVPQSVKRQKLTAPSRQEIERAAIAAGAAPSA